MLDLDHALLSKGCSEYHKDVGGHHQVDGRVDRGTLSIESDWKNCLDQW
jgi:hypothetical protein